MANAGLLPAAKQNSQVTELSTLMELKFIVLMKHKYTYNIYIHRLYINKQDDILLEM